MYTVYIACRAIPLWSQTLSSLVVSAELSPNPGTPHSPSLPVLPSFLYLEEGCPPVFSLNLSTVKAAFFSLALTEAVLSAVNSNLFVSRSKNASIVVTLLAEG